jgi:hypothetical protein
MRDGAPCAGGLKLADQPSNSGCLIRHIQALGKTLKALRGLFSGPKCIKPAGAGLMACCASA